MQALEKAEGTTWAMATGDNARMLSPALGPLVTNLSGWRNKQKSLIIVEVFYVKNRQFSRLLSLSCFRFGSPLRALSESGHYSVIGQILGFVMNSRATD